MAQTGAALAGILPMKIIEGLRDALAGRIARLDVPDLIAVDVGKSTAEQMASTHLPGLTARRKLPRWESISSGAAPSSI